MAHVHAPVATAAEAELKNFGKPDEVREFPKGRVELITIGGATIGRAIFEPGWRWATSPGWSVTSRRWWWTSRECSTTRAGRRSVPGTYRNPQ